jgi:hypothetical protein
MVFANVFNGLGSSGHLNFVANHLPLIYGEIH